MNLIRKFFDSSEFMPHGHCYLWEPQILWMHVISDSLIALAYFSIPISLLYIMKRRHDTPLEGLVGLFGAFILLCGTTHIMAVWTVWHPDYAIDGLIKLATALISVPTAYVIWRMMPQLLNLKSPAELERANSELVTAKSQIEQVIEQRTLELRKALTIAEAASNAKSEFLTNMSHELRTPMHAINGITSILSKKDMPEEQRKLFNTLAVSADTLLQLIDDILDLSKVENNEIVLEEIAFNLKNLIDEIAIINSVEAKEKNISFQINYQTGLTENFIGDPFRLKQIIMNLAGNALKFTTVGSVTINVSGVDENNKTNLQIDVTDTGIGINPNYLNTIFNKFSQEDASTTRKYGGTGLGLAIAKNLTELMKGEISVKSDKGEGAIFTVKISLLKSY